MRILDLCLVGIIRAWNPRKMWSL